MKVLIADDSKAMRQVIGHMLRQAGYGGLKVVEAVDGVEALQKTFNEAPDLVLSDWNMPNKTGIVFLQELRAAGNNVPFGFVTAEVSPEMHLLATNSGATFLIGEPFMPADFQKTLESCLG